MLNYIKPCMLLGSSSGHVCTTYIIYHVVYVSASSCKSMSSLSPPSTDHDPVPTGLPAGDGAAGISWEVSLFVYVLFLHLFSLFPLSSLYAHVLILSVIPVSSLLLSLPLSRRYRSSSGGGGGGGGRDHPSSRHMHDMRDMRDMRDLRDMREMRDMRDMRDLRDVRDFREERGMRSGGHKPSKHHRDRSRERRR